MHLFVSFECRETKIKIKRQRDEEGKIENKTSARKKRLNLQHTMNTAHKHSFAQATELVIKNETKKRRKTT